MNERIKQFAVEAKLPNYVLEYGTELCLAPHLEKFAELIVQKFDDILVLEYLDCVGSQDSLSKQRIQLLREKVKIYFGVEE